MTLSKLHAKLGDFWWYSLMLFMACRAADVLNAFVGLWLVPKYVGAEELGAVMPLTQFAGFLALPVAIFATTFMKEMTSLATAGEYGKMKSLMRGVFVGGGVFLALAILLSRLLLPAFLERIRVAEGSLGFVILAAAFTGAVAPIYQNALQALKRFREISFLNVICAPVRFLAMIVAMPFRALSGYFVGQGASPAFSIFVTLFFLRRELSVKAERYWTRPIVRRFAGLFLAIAAYNIAGALLGLVEQTVLRQRLPAIDSAAYYMATRFSDIAGYVTCTLSMILFPFTASLAAEGKSTRPLVVKSILATLGTSAALAIFFAFAGRPVLRLLPDGVKYSEFAWTIPWLIGLQALGAIQAFHLNTEVSAGRFKFLKWWIPLHLIFAAGLLFATGYGYFTAYIPQSWSAFLADNNFTSLEAMLWWFTVTTLVKTAICLAELRRQK